MKEKINPKHLTAMAQIRTITNQFNIVLGSVDNKEFKEFIFCKTKSVKTPSLDFPRNIYSKYIKCGNDVFYHIGFLFENDRIDVYSDFYLGNVDNQSNRSKAKAIEKELSETDFKCEPIHDNNYRVIARKSLDKFEGIYLKDIIKWLKIQVKAVKSKEAEINKIIN